MQEAIFKSSVLVEALPYMQSFHNKYVVVKFGGSVFTQDEHLHNVLQDLVFMRQAGMRPVLVHGGGPFINKAMQDKGIKPKFINGQRVTDKATLNIVSDVLIGHVGERIVKIIESFGGKAKTVNRELAIVAEKHMPEGVDLGFVGKISQIKHDVFEEISNNGGIPVVSPLGMDITGQLYNINGDIAAWKIAADLKAEKLVFLSNIKGIMRDMHNDDSLISTMRVERIAEYINNGTISGGMIPKVKAAENAIHSGVHKTHIVDGRLRHALLLEIFSEKGVGTQIIKSTDPEGYATSETLKLYDEFVIGNYGRLPVVINKAKGSRIWDVENKSYLDFFPGFAVSGIGYNHDKVVEALHRQTDELLHIGNNFHMEAQAILAKLIAQHSYPVKSFFCNSGAEANEAAIKLARIYHQGKRNKIITTIGSFHGRTLGSLSATGQESLQKEFTPIVPGFTYIPFNDIDALKEIDQNTAAVMIELIQGEGGINVATEKYVKKLQETCQKNGVLLIIDEVQTGMGRTGKYFSFQHFDIKPDIFTLAKSLGGGMAIGSMSAKPEISAALVPGTHGSTFGGNPMACRAGIAVFEAIDEEKMLDNVADIQKLMLKKLQSLKSKYNIITDLRGKGVMIGIQVAKNGMQIMQDCLKAGLIINCTKGDTLRMLPAINITPAEIDEGLAIFETILEKHQ